MEAEIREVLANKRSWWVAQGECLRVLKTLPDECVHLCVTSPPYYALRDYKTGVWEGGDPDCHHHNGAKKTCPQTKNNAASVQIAAGGNRGGNHRCVKCGAIRKDAQLGLEETPEEYIQRLVTICREVRRVLRDDGTFWLNIGDSYWGSWGNYAGETRGGGGQRPRDKGSQAPHVAYDGLEEWRPPSSHKHAILKPGDMCGVPWRVAMALQADGWFLRSDNLWIKRSTMPCSVKGWRWEKCRVKTVKSERGKEKWFGNSSRSPQGVHRLGDIDGRAEWADCPGCKKCKDNGGYILRKGSWRTTVAHEYIFMLAKSEEYFADGFAVRQKLAQSTLIRDRYTRVLDDLDEQYAVAHDHETISDPEQGANLRSFFVFRGEQFAGDHYACFPAELPGLAIQCGTSNKGVCSKCGMPMVRVLHKKLNIDQGDRVACRENKPKGDKGRCTVPTQDLVEEYETLDWRPSCICPDNKKPIPALVLDIFSGSGTTGIACQRTGRRYLGIELNPDYADASRERLRTRGHSVRKATKKPNDKSVFKGLP